MKKSWQASFLLLPGAIFSQEANALKDKTVRPNIIVILADDMGFSDIGCYGSEIHTPNLDYLASTGVRFRQFRNCARSCPTRASLLTGLYPHQTGIGHMTNDPENTKAFDYDFPGYKGELNNQCVTIPEVLKSSGYQTFMSGKWHLGYENIAQHPIQRGFDRFYGILAGGTNYFAPKGKRGLTDGETPVEPGEDFYLTDALTDNAIRFVKGAQQQKPYFLYLAYTSPHWPLQALKADIDKYRGKYMQGWSPVRSQRLQKMKQIGLLKEAVELSPQAGPDWSLLTNSQRTEMDLRMSIYAAQIDRMDQNIGRLIQTLKDNGTLDNTLILFLSDNGACAEGGMLGGEPANHLETRKGWVLSYGQAWANVSNTPFREYKHWTNEGGISTPLIAHWPDGIRSRRNNQWIDGSGFLPDIMATLVEVSKSTYPASFNGNKIHPLQGVSLLPALIENGSIVRPKPMCWEHEGNCALIDGDLKLVKKYNARKANNWELYNLKTDRAESHNLAGQMPKKVKEMATRYQEWADSSAVEDWKIIKARNAE